MPRFIEPVIAEWRDVHRGRLGGALALLEDDDWRLERQVDWSFSPADKAELALSEDDIVLAVAHGGVTLAFIETHDAIMVVYVNRTSRMGPGSS